MTAIPLNAIIIISIAIIRGSFHDGDAMNTVQISSTDCTRESENTMDS